MRTLCFGIYQIKPCIQGLAFLLTELDVVECLQGSLLEGMGIEYAHHTFCRALQLASWGESH